MFYKKKSRLRVQQRELEKIHRFPKLLFDSLHPLLPYLWLPTVPDLCETGFIRGIIVTDFCYREFYS